MQNLIIRTCSSRSVSSNDKKHGILCYDFGVAPYFNSISIAYSTSTETLVLLSQSERFHQNLLLSRSTVLTYRPYTITILATTPNQVVVA